MSEIINVIVQEPINVTVTPNSGVAQINTTPIQGGGQAIWDSIIGKPEKIFGETPTGDLDGENLVFTLSNNYISSKTCVYLNGLKQGSNDYSEILPNQISFLSAPLPGDVIIVDYVK